MSHRARRAIIGAAMADPGSDSSAARDRLVDELRERGAIRSAPVAEAFRAVPRELFIPAVHSAQGLDAVYRDEAYVTKQDARRMPLSSSSQPGLMAEMLERLDVRPGQRVLEIGTGTGYNAALLAHLVGPGGSVTSVDIDRELAERAGRAIQDAGYSADVRVGDGRAGVEGGGSFDRIVVTACADEIPLAWVDLLRDSGRLELPLRLDPDGTAIQLIPVLERQGASLRSRAVTWGGFMPLHGGDGGWRPPPSGLTAQRSRRGEHVSLVSLTGTSLDRLSRRAARSLLAAIVDDDSSPVAQGMLGRERLGLFQVHLLLNIPPARRVSVREAGRLGVGLLDPHGPSLAVVSIPVPWMGPQRKAAARIRWRLHAYGGQAAAGELERLVSAWRSLERAGQPELRVSARRQGDRVRVRFGWGATGRP
jgi:protein-L-isoaspartate(D-aspartate) O-methyltransferase